MTKKSFENIWHELQSIELTEAESIHIKQRVEEGKKLPVREGVRNCHSKCMDPKTFLRHVAKKVELSLEEDRDAQHAIMKFAQNHPLQKKESNHSFLNLLSLCTSTIRPIPMIAAAFLLLTGGISLSFAAETALPGDFLYSFKVNINERANASFIFSEDSRAHFEAMRLERRLEEAAKLAAANHLTDKIKSQISMSINEQLSLTQVAISELAKHGNNDAALALHATIESNLVANAVVLASIIDAEGNTTPDAKEILQEVSEVERKIAQNKSYQQSTVTNTMKTETISSEQIERNQQQALQIVQEAKEFVILKKSEINPSVLVQGNARLDFAIRMLSATKYNLENQQYDEASRTAGEAKRAALEARAMLKISANIGTYTK